ncbi:uncharacterized protein J3D65DRAFT_272546 [Phyllosticta citribraziliensis]|uniref:Uncharacterized protein n=1 Tax=Phyllosticta citribraziliensis TaxID=989973 RepID=A0ABR1M193_9PEZI
MSAKSLLFPGLLVLLLASLARSASLADFTPRVTGLTGKCLITYRKSISGCSGDDFQTAANCSARCIAGLADIAAQVARDCNDADVDNDSIIAIFLAGQGPSTLCSNAASATAAPTTSSQIIVRSSTLDLSTTPTAATSIQVDTSVPGTTTTLSISMPTSETTASTTADSTAGANEPAATTTTASTAPATTDTSSPNSHGGGDPFNLFNAAPTSAALSTWLLTIPMLLCAFWAQISP